MEVLKKRDILLNFDQFLGIFWDFFKDDDSKPLFIDADNYMLARQNQVGADGLFF